LTGPTLPVGGYHEDERPFVPHSVKAKRPDGGWVSASCAQLLNLRWGDKYPDVRHEVAGLFEKE
jgi:hypothetical protein